MLNGAVKRNDGVGISMAGVTGDTVFVCYDGVRTVTVNVLVLFSLFV